MPPLVIYHSNCLDGFTAAWACHKANPDWGFLPMSHEEAIDFECSDAMGRDVFFLDFSFKRTKLIELAHFASSIVILDHHKSAMEDLAGVQLEAHNLGLCSIMVTMNMDKSGARLAWEHFHGAHRPPPVPVMHVEDSDLYRFALPGTKEIRAALYSYDFNFEQWDRLMATHASVLVADGEALQRQQSKHVADLIGGGMRRQWIGGYLVPTLNVPYMFGADCGHAMADGQPFAATYFDTATGRSWSLYSSNDGIDVSEVATKLGGGGHRNAAGFRSTHDWNGEPE